MYAGIILMSVCVSGDLSQFTIRPQMQESNFATQPDLEREEDISADSRTDILLDLNDHRMTLSVYTEEDKEVSKEIRVGLWRTLAMSARVFTNADGQFVYVHVSEKGIRRSSALSFGYLFQIYEFEIEDYNVPFSLSLSDERTLDGVIRINPRHVTGKDTESE